MQSTVRYPLERSAVRGREFANRLCTRSARRGAGWEATLVAAEKHSRRRAGSVTTAAASTSRIRAPTASLLSLAKSAKPKRVLNRC